MRLDVVLVKRGYFTSRQRAKEAIKRGMVVVNGAVIRKPSTNIEPDAEIRVLCDERPRGYWKLKEIDERLKIFKGNEIVLDLGSSAGGFLLYASEKAKLVYGIEFSIEFSEILRKIEGERRNVRVFIEDAFRFDISLLPELDLILNDLTLPFSSSIKALKRFTPKLKRSGRILFVHKKGDREKPDFPGYDVIDYFDSRDRNERYYLLKVGKNG